MNVYDFVVCNIYEAMADIPEESEVYGPRILIMPTVLPLTTASNPALNESQQPQQQQQHGPQLRQLARQRTLNRLMRSGR